MKIDIRENISYYLVKGKITQKTPNPWIRSFLQYIDKHPNANEFDICRDLLADNGTARVAAVKNILFFFKENGLLVFNKGKGYELTADGVEALDSAKLWLGKKGVFLFTIWDTATDSFILNIQPVPEHWYDTAKNPPENFSSLYDEDNYPKLCFSEIKVDLNDLESSWIETFQDTEFEASVLSDGTVKIAGRPKVKGLEEYQVEWIDEQLTSHFIDEDEE